MLQKIDEDDLAPRPQDTKHLLDRARGFGEGMQHHMSEGRIDAGVFERERMGVALSEFDLARRSF